MTGHLGSQRRMWLFHLCLRPVRDALPLRPIETRNHMLRHSLLLGFAAGALALTAETATAQVPLTTELFAQGLSQATDLTFAPGDPTRVFIVQQGGQIRVVENGTLLATPFLNIDPIVQSGGERGLLGLAFHPDYQNNGRFFVNYTNNSGDTRVAEFSVSADPNVANGTIVQLIASIDQDFSNHNGGCIKFGPDGMLYVGMGDGGSGNDPNNRSQNGQQLLGKMLRYDVDLPSPFIPADNPFVGNGSVRDEIYHLGLRNPWRFTFDRMTGDMWIADVGQNAREEIDFIPAGLAGQNLGWRCMEGTRCTNLSGCTCNAASLLDPIQEYPHSQGCSVTGGMIYRGSAIPSLAGTYFYADFCTSTIWSLKYNGTAVTDFMIRTAELDPDNGTISGIRSFGEDFDGEVYIVTSSRVWKIVPEPPDCGWTNYCQALPSASTVPATAFAFGSTSIAANDFTVGAGGTVPGTFGIFFYGSTQDTISSSNGNLCVGGTLYRFNQISQSDIFGSASAAVDYNVAPFNAGAGQINAGDTWYFSFWFRDNQNGQAGWNFSDGLEVLFCP